MLGRKGKEMAELIERQATQIDELKQEITRIQAELNLYKQKENAIISAMTEAQSTAIRIESDARQAAAERAMNAEDSAKKIISEAQAQADSLLEEAKLEREFASEEASEIRETAAREAAAELSNAKAESELLLSKSQQQADITISEANKNAQQTLDEAAIALADYKSNIKSLNSLLEKAALNALEMSDKFAEYVDRIKPQCDSDFAEETLPKLGKSNFETPEEYESSAQLMRNIYALQGRGLPDIELESQSNPSKDAEIDDENPDLPPVAEQNAIFLTDSTDDELSALIDDVLGD